MSEFWVKYLHSCHEDAHFFMGWNDRREINKWQFSFLSELGRL